MPSLERHRLHDRENIRWVQARMMLDEQLMQTVRHGFSLIAVGFGSFAFLEGVVGGPGEASHITTPSRAFSLAATAVGIAIVLVAMRHNRRMMAWVNAEEFAAEEAPALPDEELPQRLGLAAVVVGVCSFVGLVLLR
jgi:multisubunit Na+/H+ antiporter MnhC subunit